MTVSYESGTDLSALASRPRILAIGEGIARSWIDPMRGARHIAAFAPDDVDGADLLVVAAEAVDQALIAFLADPAQAGLPLVVVAASDSADAAGALLPFEVHAFLSPEEAATRLDAAIAEVARGGGVVAEGQAMFERLLQRQSDARPFDFDFFPAGVLALLTTPGDAAPSGRPIDAARIRAHIKARRLRERFFPADLFADPAWDILLDLAAAQREGTRVSVSSLCIAANVPTTTGLRWIKAMVDRGLLLREPDPHDARRAFIILSPEADLTMDACMKACFNLPGL